MLTSVWRSEDKLGELALFFHHMESRDHTWFIKLAGKHLHLLLHLAGLHGNICKHWILKTSSLCRLGSLHFIYSIKKSDIKEQNKRPNIQKLLGGAKHTGN